MNILFTREIRDYDGADLINHSIESCDWPKLVLGKDVHEQVIPVNKTILNIFNFIPNKLIVCDDKDPPWMNNEIKTLIKRKNWLYQRQRRSGTLDYNMLNAITMNSNAMNSSKLKYHDFLGKSLILLKQQLQPIGQS